MSHRPKTHTCQGGGGVDAHDGAGGHHRDYRSHTSVPYLGLVSKKRLVNVHNNTRSTQHEWCIMVQEPPAANVPEILVCLDCCILLDFGLLSSIGNYTSTSVPSIAAVSDGT